MERTEGSETRSEPGGQNQEVTEEQTLENGCPTWTRTRNQVINSHLLYH